MSTTGKTLRTCRKGHSYYKSSDCPVCPFCEAEKKPSIGFLANLSAPARRALENAGITDLKKLASKTEKELLDLHGFGPGSLPKLRLELKAAKLKFSFGK